jgi:hypothetical protein
MITRVEGPVLLAELDVPGREKKNKTKISGSERGFV